VPLRSVEAATRDDAIAAAREQFGATARVVGVRRVRSGGVLGFFATERYVAEVDPDPAARPAVPVPAPSRGSAERRPARDDVAPRTAVPTRNGAAAWAAEARSTPSAPRPSRSDDARVDELAGLLGRALEPAAFPRASAGHSAPRAAAARPPAREAEAPVARPAVVRPAAARPAWSELLAGTTAPAAPAAEPAPAADPQPFGSAATPSPFTAALARMVAGDRHVQQAVEDALASSSGDAASEYSGSGPTWPEPLPAAQTTAPPSTAVREEEPVELQDWTPSSPSLADTVVSDWSASEPAAPTSSSREEAIAEVLRAALDEGRSDESLAGILRKVMDGAPPAVALSETPFEAPVEVPPAVSAAVSAVVSEAAVVPEIAQAVVAEPIMIEPVMSQPAMSEPAMSEPVVEAAVVEPVEVEPVVVAESAPEPVAEVEPEPLEVAVASASAEEPTPLSDGSELGWDDPISSSLWADVAPVRVPEPAPVEQQVEETIDAAVAETEEPVAEAVAPEIVAEVVAEEPVIEQELAEEIVIEDAAVEETAVEETAVEEDIVEANIVVDQALDVPFLARTASDPAPLSLDATSIMPPLSLLPPLPSPRRGGRPPVPPSVHRGASARPAARPTQATEDREAATPAESLATVTHLPLIPAEKRPEPVAAPPAAEDVVVEKPAVEQPAVEAPAEIPAVEATAVLPAINVEPAPSRPEPVAVRPQAAPSRRPTFVVPAPAPRVERPRPAVPRHRPAPAAGDLVARLAALGVPEDLLGAGFAADAAAHGTYGALTRALAGSLPETPALPNGAGEVLVVVGPGVETLRAARTLAAALRLDTDRVQWATRGDLAGLVPAGNRMATVEAAIERRQEAIGTGTLTIVAVDAPLRTDAYWTAQMLAIWSPVAVWAVVEATRKPEDLQPWIEGLPHVDALMVQDTDLSADPAAVLHRVALPLDLPVAVVDGMRATPHRWASLLCERLETPQG
jgi:hypothetical protein